MSNRKSAAQRGYNWRWVNYRRQYLRANPLCVYCQRRGRVVPATVVDHKVPHRGDDVLFWDTENHQALCKQCHDSIKQAEEKGGKVGGCDTDGIPLDSHHHWHGVGG